MLRERLSADEWLGIESGFNPERASLHEAETHKGLPSAPA